MQSSTRESPFFLLYGRDSRLPSEALSQPSTPYMVDVDDYKTELLMHGSWLMNMSRRPKCQYKRSNEFDLKVGDRVMVYMLQEKKAKSRKVARPYFGPYRVLSVTPSNVEVQLIDKPAA